MNELEEVPQPTPIIDAVSQRSMLLGTLMHIGHQWWIRRRRAKTQAYVTERWHTPHGKHEP